jgi:stage V sporulation protein B
MNVIIRIIGFSYDVLLSKLLGAEAMGLFQIAMSTIMTFLIITSSGIPTSVTKLVAEQNSKKNQYNVESIYKTAMTLNLFISLFLGIILFLSAEFIATKIFKNKDMLLGVYELLPALIILSLSTVLKSYFYGMKNIMTPSIAQIIEHLTRFIIIISILYYVCPIEPIYGAMIAILGISIGEFFDLIWSLFSKRRLYKNKSNNILQRQKGNSFLIQLLSMSLPLTISGFFSVILRFSNTILIPSRLIAAGYTSSQSVATFGRIMGMTMPLIHLPFIVTSALVVNLIPSLSEQVILKRYKDIKNDIQLSLKATFLVSIPLTAIYVTFSKSLAVFLYSDPLVADFIYIMGYGTIFMAVQHNFSGILYGLNRQVRATTNRLIGMVVQVIIVYLLVGNSKFGINGFFISYYSSAIIIMILDIFTLKKSIKLKLNYLDILGKPLLASAFMILFIYISTYNLENLQNSTPLIFISSLLVGALSYIFILVLTKAIPKNFFGKLFKSN